MLQSFVRCAFSGLIVILHTITINLFIKERSLDLGEGCQRSSERIETDARLSKGYLIGLLSNDFLQRFHGLHPRTRRRTEAVKAFKTFNSTKAWTTAFPACFIALVTTWYLYVICMPLKVHNRHGRNAFIQSAEAASKQDQHKTALWARGRVAKGLYNA